MSDFIVPDRRGLVGEWLLNGSSVDTSGNGYDWTPLNVTYSKTDRGYQTYSGNFNGSSSKVDTWYGWLTNNFSISIVLTKWDSDWVAFSMHNSWCWISSDWTVTSSFYDWADRVISSLAWYVTDSKLHHLVWVKTSTNWQALWLDWVKVADNTSHNWTLSTYTWNPWIGYFRTFNANYTSGSIQSVRIFNRAISQDEIQNWYLESLRALGGSTLAGLTDWIVAYYDMRGDANDIIGGYDGTVNGAALTTDRFGTANSAYSFDGTNDKIDLPSVTALKPTGAFSVSFWAKTSFSSTTVQSVVIQSYSQVSTVAGFQAMMTVSNHGTAPNRIRFVVGNNSGFTIGTQYQECFWPAVVNDGSWHFVECVYTGSQIVVYQDWTAGTPVSYSAGLGYTATSYQRIWCANRNASDDEWWNGQISEPIIGSSHTDSQVKALYELSSKTKLLPFS